MDTELFNELGFTEREVKVYLALLELGNSTVGPISEKTGLQRTKVYETLQKLTDKGLVHYSVISKTKHFEIANPREILNILEERKKRFALMLSELELKQKYSKEPQTAVVHDGYAAVKALYNRMADELKKGEQYCVFALLKEYRGISAPVILRQFHQKLAEKRVYDKVLAHTSVRKAVEATFKGIPRIRIRYTKRKTPLGTIMIPGKVIQLVWGDRPTAIEITSNQIHNQYKNFFDEMWREAKS